MSEVRLKKIPGALLQVAPEWCEAMGLDPSELAWADGDGTSEAAHIHSAPGTTWVIDYGGPESPNRSPLLGEGYVWDPDFLDPSFPALLYRLAVCIGAQPNVFEIWPGALSKIASHFYASVPPDH